MMKGKMRLDLLDFIDQVDSIVQDFHENPSGKLVLTLQHLNGCDDLNISKAKITIK